MVLQHFTLICIIVCKYNTSFVGAIITSNRGMDGTVEDESETQPLVLVSWVEGVVIAVVGAVGAVLSFLLIGSTWLPRAPFSLQGL